MEGMIQYIDANDFATNGYETLFANFARRYKEDLIDLFDRAAVDLTKNHNTVSLPEILHREYDIFRKVHPRVIVNCEVFYAAVAYVKWHHDGIEKYIKFRTAMREILNTNINVLVIQGYFAKHNMDVDSIVGYYDHYALLDFITKHMHRHVGAI